MSDYTYWQEALEGRFGPVNDGNPQPGFYRRRMGKGGPYLPAAIWEGGNSQIVAILDGKTCDPDALWTYCCSNPVSEEHYRDRVESGAWWDEDAAATASMKPPPASIGDNNPPADPLTVKREAIETALKGLDDYAVIGTDEAAAKAQSLRSRLLELSGEADKEREKLVRPHLDAEKAFNKDWMPLVKMAKAGADAIRAALSVFETAQQRKRDAEEADRQRVARVAQEAADKARAEAEAAGRPPPPPAPEPAPPLPAPVETKIRGSYGRAATKKMIRVATVTDQDALYPFLRTHKELVDLMAKLAQRAVDAGHNPAGVKIEEKIDVR